jgi:hypothetical protein
MGKGLTSANEFSTKRHPREDIPLTDLDKLVATTPPAMMKWSLEDVYLMHYALEHQSVQRALDMGKTTFHFGPSRRPLDHMNDATKSFLGGEPLFERGQHGVILPTETGKNFMREMQNVIMKFCESIHKIRVDRGKLIRVGATQFMMAAVTRVYPAWAKITGNDGQIDLELIRTAEVENKLLTREADLVFSACIEDKEGNAAINQNLEFQAIPGSEENIGILTNLKNLEIKNIDGFRQLLRDAYFILPERGLMHEFTRDLTDRYPELEKKRIKPCKDVFFGICILQSKTAHEGCDTGCMLMLKGAADWTQRIWSQRGYPKLTYRPLPKDVFDKVIRIGLFRRKVDADLEESHTLQRCWKVFREAYSKRTKVQSI